jgi:hypothetical protein
MPNRSKESNLMENRNLPLVALTESTTNPAESLRNLLSRNISYNEAQGIA